MITYVVDGATFHLKYNELKARYQEVKQLKDVEFVSRLPEITHLACIICYLKESSLDSTLSDKGIIHELCHLMHLKDFHTSELRIIRKKFNKICELA